MMIDETETLMRDALQRQADRAPDGWTVLEALETRPAPSRSRRTVLVGVTAAVAAALAVTAVLVVGPGGSSDQTQAATPVHHSGLAFQPHWLPSGMVEKARQSQSNETARLWTTKAGVVVEGGQDWQSASQEAIRVSTKSGAAMPTGNRHIVDINGHPGQVTTVSMVEYAVTWEAEPGMILTVYGNHIGVGGPEFGWKHDPVEQPVFSAAQSKTVLDNVVRVARSVRPDDHTARLDPQITFGHLPQGWSPAGTGVSGDNPGSSDTQLQARVTTGGYDFFVYIDWQPSTYKPRPPVGSTDNLAKLPDGSFLWVGLDGGGHAPTMKVVLQMARQVIQQHPHADVSWLGKP
jgi:hypothetical protein